MNAIEQLNAARAEETVRNEEIARIRSKQAELSAIVERHNQAVAEVERIKTEQRHQRAASMLGREVETGGHGTTLAKAEAAVAEIAPEAEIARIALHMLDDDLNVAGVKLRTAIAAVADAKHLVAVTEHEDKLRALRNAFKNFTAAYAVYAGTSRFLSTLPVPEGKSAVGSIVHPELIEVPAPGVEGGRLFAYIEEKTREATKLTATAFSQL